MSAPAYARHGVTFYTGDCLDILRDLDDNSIDAVCTDPPYGIRFMGRAWDGADIEAGIALRRSQAPMPDDGKAGANGGYQSAAAEAGRYDQSVTANQAFQQWCQAWATECLRVLKPGGHLAAFGSPRTAHRLTSGIEDAGFEIRDTMMWIFGSGFPKGKTQLKPAHEPIVLARKPLVGTLAATVSAHGTGGLNIGGCRVAHANADDLAVSQSKNPGRLDGVTSEVYGAGRTQQSVNAAGRWPTNVLIDEHAAVELDQQSEGTRAAKPSGTHVRHSTISIGDGVILQGGRPFDTGGHDGSGASRFFPVFRWEAKAPTAERPQVAGVTHPTVKPLELMRWLVRLVTPPSGVVLDPFAGSGTTLQAARAEGFRSIGIEREPTYIELIRARLDAWPRTTDVPDALVVDEPRDLLDLLGDAS